MAGLTSLVGLGLNDNSISDLQPLAELTALAGLTLQNNEIGDLGPLSGRKRSGVGLSIGSAHAIRLA